MLTGDGMSEGYEMEGKVPTHHEIITYLTVINHPESLAVLQEHYYRKSVSITVMSSVSTKLPPPLHCAPMSITDVSARQWDGIIVKVVSAV